MRPFPRLLFPCSVASAIGFFAFPAQAERFECDTPADRFSEYSRPATEGSRIAGTLTVKERRRGTYLPVANIFFRDAELNNFGVRFILDGRNSVQVVGVMRSGGEHFEETIDEREYVDPLPFDVSFHQNPGSYGELMIEIGGELHVFHTAAVAVESMSLSCSTVNVEFGDLVFVPAANSQSND